MGLDKLFSILSYIMLSIDTDNIIIETSNSHKGKLPYDATVALIKLGCCYDYTDTYSKLKCDKYTFDAVSAFISSYNKSCELKATLWKQALKANDVIRVTKFHPLYEKVKSKYEELVDECKGEF